MYSVALPKGLKFSSQFALCLVGLPVAIKNDRAFRLGGFRLRVGSTSWLMVLRAPHLRFACTAAAQWFTACNQRLYPAPFHIYIIA
ncbi:MAG: hypothetical protein HC790_08395 [Acaryochloridaceae cyanobacterium CSU_3_4]|nr:hypothetical protein [Acaryochloridaceae cyanobacterium CSU_3_4]